MRVLATLPRSACANRGATACSCHDELGILAFGYGDQGAGRVAGLHPNVRAVREAMLVGDRLEAPSHLTRATKPCRRDALEERTAFHDVYQYRVRVEVAGKSGRNGGGVSAATCLVESAHDAAVHACSFRLRVQGSGELAIRHGGLHTFLEGCPTHQLEGQLSVRGTHGMTPLKTRVLLADDHAVVRQGLRFVLDAQPDLEVVAEAGDGAEAVELAGHEPV